MNHWHFHELASDETRPMRMIRDAVTMHQITLHSGMVSLGSGKDADVQLSGANIPAWAGTIVVGQDEAWLAPAPGEYFEVDEQVATPASILGRPVSYKGIQFLIERVGSRYFLTFL
ncbi:MAG: hypothetical protein U0V64_14415 [Cyclobacteriaceae bacterium]